MVARRIAAVVLSEMLCELALEQEHFEAAAHAGPSPGPARTSSNRRSTEEQRVPLAVVSNYEVVPQTLTASGSASRAVARSVQTQNEPAAAQRELTQTAKISAVNASARAFGVRVGQSIAEACAWVAHLKVRKVEIAELQVALARVAECLFQFSPTVSFVLPDTIWLDVTGTAALYEEGEEELVKRIGASVAELGHFSRVSIAKGPLLAQAFARWGSLARGHGGIIVSETETLTELYKLPLKALPVTADVMQWLAQLGLLQLGDLAKIPAAQVTSRLGQGALGALELLQGRDDQPLHAHVPAPLPKEHVQWEEPCSGNEPLLFALRTLTARIGSRLEARGLAAQSLELSLRYDAATARFREAEPTLKLEYALASPLSRADDLWRVIVARLGKLRLAAPYIALELEVRSLALAPRRQLELVSATSRLNADPERLSTLFSELGADIGHDRLGTLQVGNSHLPEKLSLFVSVRASKPDSDAAVGARKKGKSRRAAPAAAEQLSLQPSGFPIRPPTRLFSVPRPISCPLKKGSLMPVGSQLYTIESVEFESRIECVEWWSGSNLARDYWRVGLSNKHGHVGALVFFNRVTEECFLQALYD